MQITVRGIQTTGVCSQSKVTMFQARKTYGNGMSAYENDVELYIRRVFATWRVSLRGDRFTQNGSGNTVGTGITQ